MFNFLIDTLSVPLLVAIFYGTLTILVFFKHCSPSEICRLFWLAFFYASVRIVWSELVTFEIADRLLFFS